MSESVHSALSLPPEWVEFGYEAAQKSAAGIIYQVEGGAASVASSKFVEEIIDLEEGSQCVIPARLSCLAREGDKPRVRFAQPYTLRTSISGHWRMTNIWLPLDPLLACSWGR